MSPPLTLPRVCFPRFKEWRVDSSIARHPSSKAATVYIHGDLSDMNTDAIVVWAHVTVYTVVCLFDCNALLLQHM